MLLASDEPDELIPGKILVIKAGKIAKFVAKPTTGEFAMPDIVNNNPTIEGGEVRFFDTTIPGGGDITYSLPAGGWTGIGNPAGSKGYKFKGGAGTCKVVILKPKVIKAVCKENVTFTNPFSDPGTVGVILTAGTDSKRYCAEYGGEQKKNDTTLLKRKGAPAPGMCPFVAPTPTATDTRTVTSTATITNTPTVTNTATATNTPANTATATNTAVATATATVTLSPTPTFTSPPCPLAAGSYTVTQVAGGTLDVYNFAPFPFPTGGTIVQDVSAASPPACVHNTVVPFPGGFSAPNFCVPALMFTTSVTQTGCGVGRIDSNGGSDFKTTEVADTSSPTVCSLPQPGCTNGANAGIMARVTVGDGVPDTCSSGTANALVSIPVHTKSWSDTSGGMYLGCPGNGVFDGTDMVAAEFNQFLDFTTDTATGSWSDLDPDGCSIAGFGPTAGYTRTGVCIDLGLGTITPVAVGEFGATGGLFDGTLRYQVAEHVLGQGAAQEQPADRRRSSTSAAESSPAASRSSGSCNESRPRGNARASFVRSRSQKDLHPDYTEQTDCADWRQPRNPASIRAIRVSRVTWERLRLRI